MSSFDKLYEMNESEDGAGDRPLWTIDLEDDDEVLRWCNATLDKLKKQSRYRIHNMKRNLATFRGLQFRSQNTKVSEGNDAREETRKSKNPKIVINHILDMIEAHVSKVTKFKPAVASVPGSDDAVACNTARIADDLIDKFWIKNNFDKLMQKHTRTKRICGESIVWILWNPDIGPYHPDWVAEVFKANGIEGDPRKLSQGEINAKLRKVKDWPKIDLKDEKGNPVLDSKGEAIVIDSPVRIGDIEYKPTVPWRVFFERREHESDIEFGIYTEDVHVDELRAMHPDKADKLEDIKLAEDFDAGSLAIEKKSGKVEVAHLYFRTTARLDRGRYIKFTRNAVLTNRDNQYEGPYGRIIPCDRLTDIDPPGTIDSDSLTTHGIPAQHLYNITTSMNARNRFQFAHPKWFMPQGAVKVESLGNTTSVVQYKGPAAPVLSQPMMPPADNMQQTAKDDLQQIMGVFPGSRGQPPPGITAGIALQFLDEQENERENLAIAKHNASVKNISKQSLSLMGMKYSEDEGRLELLLGRSRAAEIESFEFANLSSIEDVDLQTSSALPTQKAARTQSLIDLSDKYPEQMDADRVLDMIGLGQADKFVSLATVNVRSAELENEKLLRTGKMPEPEETQDHLTHYYYHLSLANDPSMRKYMTKGMEDEFKEHMMTTEMLMSEIAKKNPAYAALIMQKFPNFPSYLTPEELPMPMTEMAGVGDQGAPPPEMTAPPAMAEPNQPIDMQETAVPNTVL